ncbi:MAG TPA: alpha/beta family hydrolase, partial [Mycobacteriales bacterium]|nr:alpha/beta family hydrolase [Mycobacteriales bacterium]
MTARPASAPRTLVVLGHGAGGGIDAVDLTAVTDALVRAGHAVALVVQPYRVAGRRAPAPAAQLDVAWIAVCAELRSLPGFGAPVPLVVGGRSSGARVACRTAAASGAAAVLALAFPLHPPARPAASRRAE